MNDKPDNKPTTAIALRYTGKGAPQVTAKGAGLVAERILAVAYDNDVPLYENPDLVTLLSKLELGDEIPAALYQAVAEVLAFAYLISQKQQPKPDFSEHQNGEKR